MPRGPSSFPGSDPVEAAEDEIDFLPPSTPSRSNQTPLRTSSRSAARIAKFNIAGSGDQKRRRHEGGSEDLESPRRRSGGEDGDDIDMVGETDSSEGSGDDFQGDRSRDMESQGANITPSGRKRKLSARSSREDHDPTPSKRRQSTRKSLIKRDVGADQASEASSSRVTLSDEGDRAAPDTPTPKRSARSALKDGQVDPGPSETPRKRGRPRKEPVVVIPKKRGRPPRVKTEEELNRPKRGPGRPRKIIDPADLLPRKKGRPPRIRTAEEILAALTPKKKGRPPKNPDSAARSKREKAKSNFDQNASLLKPTSSDAYFLYNSSRRTRGSIQSSTSTTQISSKLGPLDPSMLDPIAKEATKAGTMTASNLLLEAYKSHYPLYSAQLHAGFSILFHGAGSKAPVLLDFLEQKAKGGEGAAVIVQGSMKGLRIEEILAEIERAAGIGTARMGASASLLPKSRANRQGVRGDGDEEGDGIKTRQLQNGLTVGGVAHQPPFANHAVASSALISRATRIASFFSTKEPLPASFTSGLEIPPNLYLALLSFDSPALQSPRFKAVLDIFCSTRRIHVLAAVSHVNCGLVLNGLGGLASGAAGGMAMRGGWDELGQVEEGEEEEEEEEVEGGEGGGGTGGVGHRSRPKWIWQQLTTYVPPLDEMLLARGTRGGTTGNSVVFPPALDLGGGSGSYLYSSYGDSFRGSGDASVYGTSAKVGVGVTLDGRSRAPANGGMDPRDAREREEEGEEMEFSEKAAIHVLKSVTVKARALFTLLAKRQMTGSNGSTHGENSGLAYSQLLELARRNFLASSEADLRQLMVEFRDHGLVRRFEGAAAVDPSNANGHPNLAEGGIVIIPMGNEALARTLEECKKI
ncbi:hypothetical protein IE53DRAFT_410086 [Violaceomyces palustris]|uniref:Uncharacterized protein n=1 Tax=Violaceomyces palustris TaxID=1673888 RepID=A0ACD0P0K2_9BASI|nr:hypothetical protein IE53DRAFT_410086 [Violaceomyces palustris]